LQNNLTKNDKNSIIMSKQNNVAVIVPGEQLAELISDAVRKGIDETEKRKSEVEKLYTINEVAKRLGKAHRTIKSMVSSGAIKSTKTGLISEFAIKEYLNT